MLSKPSLIHLVIFIVVIFTLIACTDGSWWRRRRRSCSTKPCKWTWGPCSKTCGGGEQTAFKPVTEGACDKSDMPSYKISCNTECCAVNCSWYNWESWSSCSRSCGKGLQFRTRSQRSASCGGKSCTGIPVESRSCNDQCCPVDCKWSSWGSWGSCSAKCGRGSRSRVRNFVTSPSCGGSSCTGYSIENEKCNTECCPVNCVWEEWSTWGVCSKTCNSGSQTRSRDFSVPSHCGGIACVGEKQESQLCNKQCCPVCEWGPWGSWGSCSKTCEKGIQIRNRAVALETVCGGSGCTGCYMDIKSCNDVCCPVHCELGEWSKWSSCTRSCGTGSQVRQRAVEVAATCGGQECLEAKSESRKCDEKCCPVDCSLASWSQWSECSTTCGSTGMQRRNREIDTPNQCGGEPCEKTVKEERPCNRVCFNGGEVGKVNCTCQGGWEGACCEWDMDECMLELHECHMYAYCTNLEGDYTCTCNDGFTGNGFNCTDIDECSVEDPFEMDVMNEHSYLYTPQPGHRIHSTPCHEKATCTNMVGSYQCKCDQGYSGDGVTCQDIDECALEIDPCSEFGMNCSNAIGGYDCICPDSLQFLNGTCIDIDECALGIDNCSEMGMICKNTFGGFECGCEEYKELINGTCVER